jgi:hypothetical protein
VNTDTTYQANAKIEIKDSDGNVVGVFTAGKKFNSIVFTSPNLALNESYSVQVDGTDVATLELAQVVTTSGEVGGFGGGGHGGFGGGNPGDFSGDRPDGFNGEKPDGSNGERPDDFSGEMPEEFNGDVPGDTSGEIPQG